MSKKWPFSAVMYLGLGLAVTVMQHIALDRRQPVDYCSPGPGNGLTVIF